MRAPRTGSSPDGPGRGAARLGGALAALLALAGAVPPVLAANDDFSPANPYWNGTAALVARLQEAGATVVSGGRLDWSALGSSGLILLDPRTPLDLPALERHLRRGGRVLLGVERGPGQAAAARFGVRVTPGPVRATLTHRGQADLPFALPARDHPLLVGEPLVLANHAASIPAGGEPLLSWAGPDAGALLVEVELGAGRLAVLADPSILIDNMLEFPGNLQLATNLAGWLCGGPGQQPGACRIELHTGHFAQRSGWQDDLAELQRRAAGRLQRLDRALTPGGEWLWQLACLLLIAGLLGVLLALPGEPERPRQPAPPFSAGQAAPPDDLDSWVAALAGAPARADLRLGLAMLAEQARPELQRHLGRGTPAEQIGVYLRRHGEPEGGEAALAGLLAALAAAPSRADLYAPGVPPVDRAELDDLLQRWRGLRERLERGPVRR